MSTPERRHNRDGADRVGLQYVDLLYAVPVAELGTRIADTHLHGVPHAAWSDAALALTAVTFGWIGHHRNRQLKQDTWQDTQTPACYADRTRPFTSLWLLQFVVEVAIIGAYFALVARLVPHGAGGPSERWKLWWLAALFGLYVVWDLLDIALACGNHESQWARRAACGGVVTLVFAAVFAVLALVVSDRPLHSVVLFDVLAIFVLWVYRAVQQGITKNKLPPTAAASEVRTAQPA